MLHELVKTWFVWVEQWGVWGVFILMAMESSVFPVPSEIVMAPAAFWAAQGKMSFVGVILAGTAGSLIGALITYYMAQFLGRPFLSRYGKYVFMPSEKIALAEAWARDRGLPGVFFARLLPVIRHFISIPAGILKMNVVSFSLVTTLGAGLWCSVLAWFGKEVIGDHPELLQSPEDLSHVMKAKLIWFVGAIVVLMGMYIYVNRTPRKSST